MVTDMKDCDSLDQDENSRDEEKWMHVEIILGIEIKLFEKERLREKREQKNREGESTSVEKSPLEKYIKKKIHICN